MKMKLLIFHSKDGCGAEFSYSEHGTLHQSCWVSQKPRSHYPTQNQALMLFPSHNSLISLMSVPIFLVQAIIAPTWTIAMGLQRYPQSILAFHGCQKDLAKHESITTLPYLKYPNGFLFYLRWKIFLVLLSFLTSSCI